MRISILDDYSDTLCTLDCFSKLADHEVTVWNDHVQDVDILAERLCDCEALVLIRGAPRSAAHWSNASPSSD
jgi:D-3-phosphoglycerate dehydrogenase